MSTENNCMGIVAVKLPETIDQFQLALEAAFSGGVAFGKGSRDTGGEIEWVSVEERLPDPDLWLVTVDTDSGPMVYVLELNDRGQWIHEGEPTFAHGYYFRPTHWARIPEPASTSEISDQEAA